MQTRTKQGFLATLPAVTTVVIVREKKSQIFQSGHYNVCKTAFPPAPAIQNLTWEMPRSALPIFTHWTEWRRPGLSVQDVLQPTSRKVCRTPWRVMALVSTGIPRPCRHPGSRQDWA
ncbi:hypothetical protein Y1Q_0001314 [Alligator mississippiensis]|uniref:Uncharacterized protein n=1 Tax=Alligator mississippiensis TaxID=8496 RepID=A0A151M904_ALLMI|nr:hypothetical protein Y1Q_0001314 [Alligator mississippiensis]